MLHWYARQLCLRYDYTCCSRMKAPHLPFLCKFNDNETLASYARGIYDYYEIKLKCCNGMLGIYAQDMIILVALG